MSRDFPRWVDLPGWHEQDQARRERRAQEKQAKKIRKDQQRKDRTEGTKR